ncbi:MAG: hypothetical protein KDD83_24280, partial [Caldilineaceae bacterium]|nr:hypothetical protein [Caldilineaceae bacterium]
DGLPQAIGCADWRWVTFDELDAYPFPVTDQKIIAALAAEMDTRIDPDASHDPGQKSGIT